MLSEADFRRIALGMASAVEGSHMGHPDFRLHGRIFATLRADGRHGMVKLTPDQQQSIVRERPEAFVPESGAWGRQGCTSVRLDAVDEDTLGEAMTLAWQDAGRKGVSKPATKRPAKGVTKRATRGPRLSIAASPLSAHAQLKGFLAKYSPAIVKEATAALARLRRLVPGAVELVYDNYNGLVVGFGPSDRPSEAVVSLLVVPRWVTLCFIQNGPEIPDPSGLLKGEGRVVRHLRLGSAQDLEKPAIKGLVKAALARADVPIDPSGRRRLVIRSISAKQRSRRPG